MSRHTADCSQCCGLCCIVPAYLREQGFPFDKPAERPCRHLDRGGACAIHAERLERGFGACIHFDCHGAGQWITQHLFAGAHWTTSPATRQAMAEAYRQWLPRFEAAALLEAALPLVPAARRPELLARIDVLLDPESCRQVDGMALRRDTLRWIRGLLTTGTAR
jgi:hypothetical protein